MKPNSLWFRSLLRETDRSFPDEQDKIWRSATPQQGRLDVAMFHLKKVEALESWPWLFHGSSAAWTIAEYFENPNRSICQNTRAS
mmetsp:Transcript_25404/g.52873  ORF Transcript_25404/g.52873 Transcript_25404/m.52873 type:complete len:85 (-) Transcript_25404:754-1008(-)